MLQKQCYISDDSEQALRAAECIRKWATDFGTVYITGGGHPLDTNAVTTPELYLHAIETLHRMGYEVRYCDSDGVTVEKRKTNDPSQESDS